MKTNDFRLQNLSRKIAGNIVVKCNRIILHGREDKFQFRAYEPGRYINYLGHLKTDRDLLGEIATRRRGKSLENEALAVKKIFMAFPEISGHGIVYSGYVELTESQLVKALNQNN